jgi:hypothetical protein
MLRGEELEMYRIVVVLLAEGEAKEAVFDYPDKPVIDTMDGVLALHYGDKMKAIAPGYWSSFKAYPVEDPE